MSAARQLVLRLGALPPDLSRESFLVSESNRAASDAVRDPDLGAAGRLVLVGPPGSGKSHLAAIWAREAGARIVDVADLTEPGVEALSEGGAWVIEDADTLAGQRDAETLLFHALNLVQAHGGRLLLTARREPSRWGIATPDLLSRLNALPSVRIGPPDDALLSSILDKLFSDKQLSAGPGVTRYLVARMERSFAAAVRVVDALDRMALAEGRNLNRALAQDLMRTNSAAVTGEGEN